MSVVCILVLWLDPDQVPRPRCFLLGFLHQLLTPLERSVVGHVWDQGPYLWGGWMFQGHLLGPFFGASVADPEEFWCLELQSKLGQ